MDFGPVVKPLGITVKKEGGKVVETSVVVKPQESIEKGGKSPHSPKWTQKRAQNVFDFQNIAAFEVLTAVTGSFAVLSVFKTC